MVHLFVVFGYQAAENEVVCVGQPLLIAGDLNADPGVIPCLAKGISCGQIVDLALAYSLGAGRKQDDTCKFKLDECGGSRRDLKIGCRNALTASTACRVTDRWFSPHFSVSRWTAEVSCPVPSQPVWPACWIDTRDRSSSSSTRAVQDAWDIFWEELGVVPPDLILTLRNEYGRSDVDGFWIAWSKGAEEGLFRAYRRAGGPVEVDAFFGWSAVRVCRRRLGGKSVGGGRSTGAGRL